MRPQTPVGGKLVVQHEAALVSSSGQPQTSELSHLPGPQSNTTEYLCVSPVWTRLDEVEKKCKGMMKGKK